MQILLTLRPSIVTKSRSLTETLNLSRLMMKLILIFHRSFTGCSAIPIPSLFILLAIQKAQNSKLNSLKQDFSTHALKIPDSLSVR